MNPPRSGKRNGTHIVPYQEAMANARNNRGHRNYPDSTDPRARHGTLYPDWQPKFNMPLNQNTTVFTIGSCFARNIEEALSHHGVNLPTQSFLVPKSEWPFRPNGLLNEYNPGTIAQRILHAHLEKPYPEDTLVPAPKGFADLLLLGGSDVSFERAIQRREDIATVYSQLAKANLVVITLGLIEAWYDKETETHLNRIPPRAFALKHPQRFEFRQLGVDDCLELLSPAISTITDQGTRVVLTVSPVPLGLTFSGQDCIVANEYSKSILRICAHELSSQPEVDYFPSYEIVRSGGLPNFADDNIHVKDHVVREITRYMTERLIGNQSSDTPP